MFVIIQTWDNVGGPISDGRSVAQKISATLKHAVSIGTWFKITSFYQSSVTSFD